MNEKQIILKGTPVDYVVTTDGDVYSLNYGKSGKKHKLSPCKNKGSGYLCVNLYYKKKLHRKYIHRLVAEAFIPNPNSLPQVNHIDGNKKNNSVENLEWVTEKENTEHAFNHKLRTVHFGENATDSKVSEKTARKICEMLEQNEKGTREIADSLGVSFPIVSNIKHKKAWTHISKEYDIDRHTIKSKPVKTTKKKGVKMSESDALKICELLENTNLPVS